MTLRREVDAVAVPVVRAVRTVRVVRMTRVVRGITGGLVAILLLGAVVACAESLDEVEALTGVTEVAVKDDFYEPRVIEVPAGTEVTWVWEGRRGHDVVSNLFRTSVIREGEFAHTFDEPGVWDYICTLHAGMTGRVIVTE